MKDNKMNIFEYLDKNHQIVWYTLFGIFMLLFFGMIFMFSKI